MSHQNSFYTNDDTELASPIAAHHSSIASSAMQPRHTTHRPPSINKSASGVSQSMARQQEELSAIQAEIESLKERRRQLEMQRRFAVAANAPTIAAAGRPFGSRASSAHTTSPRASQNTSTEGAAVGRHREVNEAISSASRHLHVAETTPRSSVSRLHPRRSHSQGPIDTSSRTLTASAIKPIDHTAFIPSEQTRREKINAQPNPYRDMKEAMKASWQSDTTLIGGYFLVEDNPKVGTFGRARRFTQLQGQESPYYLSTNVQLLQERARSSSRPHFSVSNRGKSGCNVNSNWNDPRGGVAPGPGAYTPRYQKLAPPSILSRK